MKQYRGADYKIRLYTGPKTAFFELSTLQKFASIHANIHHHFNSQRHLIDRQTCKTRRSVALAELQNLMA